MASQLAVRVSILSYPLSNCQQRKMLCSISVNDMQVMPRLADCPVRLLHASSGTPRNAMNDVPPGCLPCP
eukprot:scaffold168894_cov14-Prasinocladus_malaysianus.AAC.1